MKFNIKLRLLLALLLLVLLSDCSKDDTSRPAPAKITYLDSAEYVVLSVVIDSIFPIQNNRMYLIIDSAVLDHNGSSDSTLNKLLEYVIKGIPSLQEQTITNFKFKAWIPTCIEPKFMLHVPYKLVKCKYFCDWNYQAINYPNANGFTEVSRVGFNSDSTQALVYVGNMEAPLAGDGIYIVLYFQNGKWKIFDYIISWVS